VDTLFEESKIIERSLLFGKKRGALHKKEVNNALRALLRSNLIYKELSEDGRRYRYAIKQVPYLAFMFEDSFCGKTDTCENLRDIIILFPYRILAALWYYRPSETILELFGKMEAAGGSIPDDSLNYYLMEAARRAQDTAVLEKLLELGCNIGCGDEDGDSAFMTACTDNPSVDVLEWLKNHKAYTAVLKDEDGLDPLHKATLFNPNPRVVQWLLDNGYNPLAEDRFGFTVLCYAFYNENLEIFYVYARQPWFNINGKVKTNLSNDIFDELISELQEYDFDREEDHDKIIEKITSVQNRNRFYHTNSC
jgi:hypothetical protein